MSLQNIQAEFSEMMLSEDEHSDVLMPTENMIIYRNNMLASLVRSLFDTYPMIVKLVGDDFFRTMATEYVHRYPSRSSNLHDYGNYFSDFLMEYEPAEALDYLPEVAQFEWFYHTLHFASDHAPFNLELLAHLSPDQYDHLHFILHPASCVHSFDYPILRIIDLCKNNVDEDVNLDEGGDNILMIRRELDIELISLNTAEYIFLLSLQDNMALSDALEETMQADSNFQLDENLSMWIKEKIIVDCY